MIRRVLLDLDGVLADFQTGMREILFPGKELGSDKEFDLGVGDEVLWKAIEENPEFWENLKPTKECFPLYQVFKDYVGEDNVYFCTSPGSRLSTTPDACAGKIKWIANHFGEDAITRAILTRSKHCCARPDSLLLDDTPKKIKEFLDHEGIALLMPRPWNQDYLLDTLDETKKNFTSEIKKIMEAGR